MKILFLGYDKKKTSLINFLEKRGHKVKHTLDKVNDFSAYDFVISFGYQHIIKKFSTLARPIINLHISYLPFNRGAHPNFWAHYDRTPSGVSIHEIDEGIDTGPVLFQKKINFNNNESLESSYIKLHKEIEKLFIDNIVVIENNEYEKHQMSEIGTFHVKKELPNWVKWQMTIEEVHKKDA
tara:strand:+ start:209 stop:751 length:543 start_codon:yes stop_codon:yes gene_type:complete